jgi:predicted transcriptional regulator
MPLARSSGNNAKRIEAVKQTISYIQLAGGGLSVRDLADLLKVSDSTVKGYLWAMLDGQIVTRKVHKDDAKHPTARYTVTANEQQIRDFIETLKFDPSKTLQPRPRAPKSPEQRMAQDPGRRFHIAGDDEPVKIRISRQKLPDPDPLLAAFYGMTMEVA